MRKGLEKLKELGVKKVGYNTFTCMWIWFELSNRRICKSSKF